jgi:hypothetical protein
MALLRICLNTYKDFFQIVILSAVEGPAVCLYPQVWVPQVPLSRAKGNLGSFMH